MVTDVFPCPDGQHGTPSWQALAELEPVGETETGWVFE
ncbi:hypothetical protein CKA32_006380 [Geitlerinema sp. FC II]|nr:hypothetical protein CKA32_006380 [Geitlerinema sp. FC II]